MSASVIFYTQGRQTMEHLSVITPTDAATGFPAENLFDNNPDTSWKGASTGNKNIVMDFGINVGVTGLYMFINNYKSITGSEDYSLWYSDNDSDYFTASMGQSFVDIMTPHRLTTGSLETHRYWRLKAI